MSKNKDRREYHKNQKRIKLTFHHKRLITKAVEEIRKYEASKA